MLNPFERLDVIFTIPCAELLAGLQQIFGGSVLMLLQDAHQLASVGLTHGSDHADRVGASQEVDLIAAKRPICLVDRIEPFHAQGRATCS